MSNLDIKYLLLLTKVLIFGSKRNNTIELLNTKIVIKNIKKPILNVRNISYRYLLNELYCYFTATNKLSDFVNASDKWNNFTDDNETINSAYGYIILEKHYNQVKQVIDILKSDKNSRRAVINISEADLNRKYTHDEECTIALHFILKDNKLNCTTYMRSNDLYYGLPYDVAFFMLLQQYIALCLNKEYGTYTHIATSSHIYLRDLDKIKYIYKNIFKHKKVKQFTVTELPYELQKINKGGINCDIRNL